MNDGFNDFDLDEDLAVDLGEEFERRQENRTLPPEKRLSSPITTGLLERMLKIAKLADTEVHTINKQSTKRYGDDSGRRERYAHWVRDNPEYAYSSITKPLCQYADMLTQCDSVPTILTAEFYPILFKFATTTRHFFHRDLRLARKLFDKQSASLLSLVSDVLKPLEIEKFKQSLIIPSDVSQKATHAASCEVFWDMVVEKYRYLYTRKSDHQWREVEHLSYMCGTGFLLIKFFNRTFLMTYEQLQMIQDACAGRAAVALALHLKLHNGTSNLPTLTERVLTWQEKCLFTYSNEGYELVKAPESVFKARLNSLTSGDLLKHSSYDRTIEKAMRKEIALSNINAPLIASLDAIALSVDRLEDVVELFGLAKLSGHPSVYANLSAESVRSEAMPNGMIRQYNVRLMTRMFKHIVLSAYIARHSAWPPFIYRPRRGTVLRRHYNNQITDLPMNSYPLSDLDTIEFAQFVNFDYSEDYLKFLDDKAICPGAESISAFWFKQDNADARRLLTKIIQLKDFDTFELVERMRKGQTLRDEEVVELTQKERELKITARCFCKLPFAVRTFFTLTEFNLGEHFMSQYFPQQTMTMSNTEVKSRLYQMVKTSRSRDKTLLEVDFSRWNLRWRQETVYPISSRLEDIFGLSGVFSQAHPFFERATVVLTDKHTIPDGVTANSNAHDWPEGELVWRGHKGGFEGIQQKLWTICTICMMYTVVYDQNVSFLMAGQGDNQIFALKFDTTNETAADQLRRLLAIMEIRCRYLNHEVKPDECIDSSTVLTYSKDIYIQGTNYLYSLKFFARTLSVMDSDVPSLNSEVASASATSVAIADNLNAPFKGVYWQNLRLLRIISYRRLSPNYEDEHTLLSQLVDEANYEFSLSLPGSLGGLPIQSWGRFFMKGEVDELSWDVAATKRLSASIPALRYDLRLLLNGEYSVKKPSLRQLILDPKSIPIRRPKDQARLIKEHVAKALPGKTANRWIREIFNSATESNANRLLSTLATMSPLYPNIASDIYSHSLAGVRDALFSRFTMTRTIVRATGSKSFLREIILSNNKLMQFVIARNKNALKRRDPLSSTLSTFDICRKLRALWGPTVHHENIGTYCPLDSLITSDITGKPCIGVSTRTPCSKLLSTVGPYPPNFGSKTKQRIADHGYKIVESSSTVQDLKRLCTTLSELGDDPSVRRLIGNLTDSRCHWSIVGLKVIMPTVYGGAAAHRHDQLNASHFNVLGNRTPPTHFNLYSDNAGVLSGGDKDYPIAFQEYFLYLGGILTNLSASACTSRCISLACILPDVLTEIVNDVCTIPDEPPLPTWEIHPSNALCYVTTFQFEEIPDYPPANMLRHFKSTDLTAPELLCGRLFSKTRFKTESIGRLRSTGVHPIDALDMKEFLHIEPGDIIKGYAWFCAIESVYHALMSAQKYAGVELYTILSRVVATVAPALTRNFLHPKASDSRLVREDSIFMDPGYSGMIRPIATLEGIILERAMLCISSRELIMKYPRIPVFEDGTHILALTQLKFSLFLLSMSSYSPNKLIISGYDKMLLMEAYRQVNSKRLSVVSLGLIINASQQIIDARRGKSLTAIYAGQKVFSPVFLRETADESIRVLRSRSHSSLPYTPPIIGSFNFTTATGVVRIKKNIHEGSLTPLHECKEDSRVLRRLDYILSHLLRPFGMGSSAISTWNYIFERHKPLIQGKIILSVGVGRGAVAACALSFSCKKVIGADLRQSWPLCTQREMNYIPPELNTYVNSSRELFEWDPSVWSGLSDITDPSHELPGRSETDVWVIDIEQPWAATLSALANTPANITIFLRLAACTSRLTYILGFFDKPQVYCFSALSSLHTKLWIITGTSSGRSAQSYSSERYEITTAKPFLPRYDRDLARATLRVNRLLRRFGLSTKYADLGELKRLSTTLSKEAINTNDDELRNHCQAMATTLDAMRRITKESPSESSVLWLLSLPRSTLQHVLFYAAESVRDVHSWRSFIFFKFDESLVDNDSIS